MKAGEVEDFMDLMDSAESGAKNDWEMEFVESMRGRWRTYMDDMFISEAQLQTLKKIAGDE